MCISTMVWYLSIITLDPKKRVEEEGGKRRKRKMSDVKSNLYGPDDCYWLMDPFICEGDVRRLKWLHVLAALV